MELTDQSFIGQYCTVRPFTHEDIPIIFAEYCDPQTMRYLNFMRFENTPEALQSFTQAILESKEKQKNAQFIRWVIEANSTKKVIGTCAFTDIQLKYKNANYGTILNHQYWGQKFGLEARIMAIEYGFEKLGLKRIDFHTTDKNILVQNHFKKLKIPLEGIKKRFIHYHSEVYDQLIYAIFDYEWDTYKQYWKELLKK